MKNPDVRSRLAAVLGPDGTEVTCEVCFDRLDVYVEAELAGADAEQVVPGMSAHLIGCPACSEEHASMLALLRSDAPATREERNG
jgi:hypothetical protein